ncbi:hypothetical protein [Paenibacillus pini]|uniref:Uncharacterized protein n=1 Tax=Paenibacillus pini JCM 16418 TaxID=1236976 RepID=W7YVX7_9BACL|nr:hypothetical protein [Paenibacillus pini]GAF08781.1 hypothetical protein JCM16418_2886 [Paenibacillus pini JCM 16418]
MAESTEYAQIVRFRNLSGQDNYRGSQCYITLPTKKELVGADVINFYCGLTPSGASKGFECGVSTRPSTHGTQWRIFTNGPEGDKNNYGLTFNDGDTLSLKLYLNDDTNKVEFKVNNNTIFTSAKTYANGQARIVIAGGQNNPDTTKPFIVKHSAVSVSEFMLKNSAKQWASFSNTIGNYDVESWPASKNLPKLYKVTWNGGDNFKASLQL